MSKTIKKPAAHLIVLLLAAMLMLPAAAAGTGFSVTPYLPENQQEGTTGYFDLWVQPGQKQDLTVTVSNQSAEEIAVSVEAVTASTNRNGIVNYTSAGLADTTLKYSFKDIAVISESLLTLQSAEQKDITITVAVPDEPFDGILLGSLLFTKALTEEQKIAGGIVNQYSYVIAVRLRETETEIPPDFVLGNVTAGLENYRASVTAQVRNPLPILIKGVSATARLVPKGGKSPVLEKAMEKVDFAPNTIFPFTLKDEAGQGLQGGVYEVFVTLQYEDKDWNLSQEVEIKAEEAAIINEGALNQLPEPGFWELLTSLPVWVVASIAAGIIFLMIFLIIFLLIKSKKDKQERAELQQMFEQLHRK